MRVNCRHYESRTYPSGDTVRKCDLDLAPEAPWRCPADCQAFAPRLVEWDWNVGSLGPKPGPEAPREAEGPDVARLLDEAEDIVNAVLPSVLEEVEKARRPWWKRRGRQRPGPFGRGRDSR